MPLERIVDRFRNALATEGGSLLPYFTSGYPDVASTVNLIQRSDKLGAFAVEIGIPYSDSIADGPVIQESFNYVLNRGHTLEKTFELISDVRPTVECGLIAMVSFSIVHSQGVDAFMDRAVAAGFDGVIIPDVPLEETGPTSAASHRAGLCNIGLVAPTTPPDRCEAIARNSTGFVYQIAVSGTTGQRASMPTALPGEVAQLRKVSGLPVCVGFGISTPDHVREVCKIADGAIIGSAIIRRITEELDKASDSSALLNSVSTFLGDLIAATKPPVG